ncbi:universal stress protein [Pleomorphovibrio marinus]|uniref:universal stress protein n=1 Tax=Pleomorphovibrio marinus TaxID=2164132 RepID=UPI000E0AB473|nr:universal stress protein [Pleomorphovibrio marinus]
MKILVPTDLSDNAKNAINFAKAYAKFNDASITLLYAYYAVYDFAAQAQEIITAIEKDASKALKMEVNDNKEGFQIDYKIVQGTVATAVSAAIMEGEYDMIIMGTQGASGIKKNLIGSNTATVIKESEVPVIAVPKGSSFSTVVDITVAVELTKEDEKLFKKLVRLTESFNFPYSVLHIESEESFDKAISFKGLESYLKETYPDCSFEFIKVKEKNFDRGIDLYLKDHPNTFMVMLSKDKTFFEFLFNKSHSMELAYHTHVPLLVIK